MSNTARPKSAGDKLSADEVNKDLPILLNAGETINGATLPVAGCILSDADGASTKRISQETNDNHSSQIWGQTFTTDATMNRIDSVMLKIDATATATINIYAVDGSGFPTGGSLGSTSVVVNGSGQDTFSFSTAVIVSPSTKYAVCLTASLNTYFATGDTYANGDAIYYDAGEWKNYGINAIDLEFNVYGHVFTASDGKAYACDGNDTSKLSFLGFLVSNSTNGNPIQLQKDGVVSGFTGLTIGSKYYVQDAVGTIGTNEGTYIITVGIAISETELLIEKEVINQKHSASAVNNSESKNQSHGAGNYTLTIAMGQSNLKSYEMFYELHAIDKDSSPNEQVNLTGLIKGTLGGAIVNQYVEVHSSSDTTRHTLLDWTPGTISLTTSQKLVATNAGTRVVSILITSIVSSGDNILVNYTVGLTNAPSSWETIIGIKYIYAKQI